MILFSDLDRTIVHPIKLLAADARGWEPVERWQDRDITCMSSRSLKLLAQLSATFGFVPVTTRSVAQVMRIEPVVGLASNGWVICTNGAKILRGQAEDATWGAHIASQIVACAPPREAQATLDQLLGAAGPDRWLQRWRDCEGVFLYAMCDLSQIPDDVEFAVREALAPLDWTAYLHGRKLYAIPRCVTKHEAAAYLNDLLGNQYTVGAGDSEMDRGLVQWADEGWVPAGSELAEVGCFPSHVRLGRQGHISFTEEMLDSLLRR